MSWGHKEQRAWSLVRRGLLAKYLAGVSVTTEFLSGGKWLLYILRPCGHDLHGLTHRKGAISHCIHLSVVQHVHPGKAIYKTSSLQMRDCC